MSMYKQFGYKKHEPPTPTTYTYAESIATQRLRAERRHEIFWGIILLVVALIGGYLILFPVVTNWGIQ